MSGPPFSWMWRDPSTWLDRKRELDRRIKRGEARELENKRKRIKRLVKEAKARQLKGQR